VLLFTLFVSSFIQASPVTAAMSRANSTAFNCTNPADPIRIMPVGDSITKGTGSLSTGGYRQMLFESLTGSPYSFEVDFVGNKAEPSGATFDNNYNGGGGYYARNNSQPSISIYHLMDGWLDTNPPDILLLHIGTNDVEAGHESATEIADILNVIDAFDPNIYVVLGLITNRQDDSEIYFDNVSIFNASVNTMAQGRAGDLITVVDMEHALNYPADLSGDLLHPNLSGYTKMADEWLGAVVDLCLSKPVITGPGNQSFAEGDDVSLSITADDPEDDPIVEYRASNLPPGLQVNSATGLISGTVGFEAFIGSPYAVTVTAEDDTGAIGSAIYSWAVTNTNRAPLVEPPGNQSSPEGGTISPLQIDAQDPDGDDVVFDDNGSLPDGLSIHPNTGQISGELGYDAAGSYPVEISVTDDGSPVMSESVSFTWTVIDTNRPPVFDVLPGNQADNEGEPVSLQILASDPDPEDTLVYSASGLPEGVDIDPATGKISGVLTYKASTGIPHPVSVTVGDGSDQETANFTWQVFDRNGTPQIADPGAQTDTENQSVVLQLQASDPDLNDTITFSLGFGSLLPDGLHLDSETGVISGLIGTGAATDSPYSVTIIVQDDGTPQLTGQVTFDWNVVPFNYPNGDIIVFLPMVIR
jgi:lysophospholipase L1-like esterase